MSTTDARDMADLIRAFGLRATLGQGGYEWRQRAKQLGAIARVRNCQLTLTVGQEFFKIAGRRQNTTADEHPTRQRLLQASSNNPVQENGL